MTSVATAAPTAVLMRFNRRAVVTAIAGVGAVVAVVGGLYVAQSDILFRPVWTGVLRGTYVAAFVAAGVYTWWRRPTSGLGLLLVGLGFVYGLSSLNASQNDVVFALGMTAWAVYVAMLVYVALCFPRDRPTTRLEHLLARAIWLTNLALWGLILVFAQELPKGGEFADCGSDCPANGLQVVETPHTLGRALNGLYGVTLVLTLTSVGVLLFAKARSPSRLRRRAVEPLSYVVAATIVLFVLNGVVVRFAPGTKTAFWLLEAVVGLAAPIAIVTGQVRGRMFAATGTAQLVAAMSGRAVTAEGVEALIRETLGDPTLVLLVGSGTAGYTDSSGATVELPDATEAQVVTPVVRGGRTVAALIHDQALDTDAAVVEGLAASALMLLENARLVDELRASRTRIVTAAEEERLRLERDLHDGAQQRIMTIQIKLALLSDRVDERALAAELDEIGGDAAAAVAELRGLAHGIYPTVLRERGLGDGLRALAQSLPLPVEVVDDGIGRFESAVEAAIYYCVAEAIQNTTKHAGTGTHVAVSLELLPGEVSFAVVDDGLGFDPGSDGSGIGLVSMRDRIGAVGGEVEIVSSPGGGTTVRGRVPTGTPGAPHPFRTMT